MKFKNELNQKLFNREELRPEVKSRLLGVAHAFADFAEIPSVAIVDIRLLGSNANYNYNKYSDIDLHLVINYNKVSEDSKLLTNYLWAVKSLFNFQHEITIRGLDVEVYCEPQGTPATSNGVYSLDKGWLKKPEPIPPTENDRAVKAKFEELKEAIDKVSTGEEAKEILTKVYKMRKAGLAEGGEFSTENLAFKQLRNKGLLDKLRELTKEDIDRELSLESLQEDRRNNKMEVTELIARLEAIRNFAKDIHYTVSHRAAYAEHLLADLVQDDIGGFIDDIKENVIMGGRELPKSSKVYLQEAIKYIPDIREGKDRENFISLIGLVDSVRLPLKDMDTPTRGTSSLYDAIGEHLDKMAGLLYMQTRLTDGLNEGLEDVEAKEDHTDGKETKVDRKEYEAVVPKREEAEKVAKTVVKQSDEEMAVDDASESILDKLARELGVE